MREMIKMKGENQRKHLAIACILLLSAAGVSAISLGAGPGEIKYGKLLKGGYAEETVTVSTAGDEDLDITVTVSGDVRDWVSIHPPPKRQA